MQKIINKSDGKEYYNIMNSIDTQMLLGTNIKSDMMYFSELLGIDPDFIKDDLKKDELLIYEKGLKPILARKDYFFDNEMWNNIQKEEKMNLLKTTFYDEFACIGAECPLTCCGGWMIAMEEKTLKDYRMML